MDRIKLKFLNCSYSIQEENGVVVANSTFKWGRKSFNTTGVSRCDPAIFDKKIGMQLARARAERQAYIIARKDIKSLLKDTNKVLSALNNSLDFFNECINHQDEYIDTF